MQRPGYRLGSTMGKKLPTISDGLRLLVSYAYSAIYTQNSHVVFIATDCKREATGYFWITRIDFRVLQGATSEHRLLRVVECDGSKLFPVANKMVLDNNVMNRKLSLIDVSK